MYIADNTAEQDLAQAILDGANKGYDMSLVADIIAHQHRTLQQGTAGLVCHLISRWAELHDQGCYDLRNEASTAWARQVKTDVGTPNFPFI